MKISVIIPVYNVAQYIRPCVEVVLRQTYRNLEIILVDDGSTDNSGQICEEYAATDSRIRVIHKDNGGLSDARNVGTEIATGDYLIYLDSDDRWATDDFVERLVDRAVSTRADMILFAQGRFVDDESLPIPSVGKYCLADFEGSIEKVIERLIRKQQFPTSAWSKMVRTYIIQDNHIEFTRGLLGEDMDWNNKLLPHVRSIAFCNEACYFYRERSNSITTTFRLKNAEDFAWTLETWKAYWENSQNPNRRIYLGYLAYLYVTLVYRYMDIAAADREKIYGRIAALAPLLQYSITDKSDRLRKLQRLVGIKLMIYISSTIQHFRTTRR